MSLRSAPPCGQPSTSMAKTRWGNSAQAELRELERCGEAELLGDAQAALAGSHWRGSGTSRSRLEGAAGVTGHPA